MWEQTALWWIHIKVANLLTSGRSIQRSIRRVDDAVAYLTAVWNLKKTPRSTILYIRGSMGVGTPPSWRFLVGVGELLKCYFTLILPLFRPYLTIVLPLFDRWLAVGWSSFRCCFPLRHGRLPCCFTVLLTHQSHFRFAIRFSQFFQCVVVEVMGVSGVRCCLGND